MNAANDNTKDNRSKAMKTLGWSLFLIYNPALKQEPDPADIMSYKIIKSDSLEKVKHITMSIFNNGGFDDISGDKNLNQLATEKINSTIRELDPDSTTDIDFSFVSAMTLNIIDVVPLSLAQIDERIVSIIAKPKAS